MSFLEGFYFATLILSTILPLGIALYIFLRDPMSRLNKFFLIMSLGGSVFAGGEAIGFLEGILPNIPGKYLFWSKVNVSGGWLILPSILLLAAEITNKRNLIKNKLLNFYLWGGYFLIIFLLLFTQEYLTIEQRKVVLKSPAAEISFIFYGIPILLGFFWLLFKGYNEKLPFFRKKQIKYTLIGLGIPVISAILLFVAGIFVQRYASLQFKLLFFSTNFTASSISVGFFIIALGILKYSIFINYRETLEIIFKKLTDLVIVMDKMGTIALLNDSLLESLGYTKEKIEGKKLEEFLKNGEKEWEKIKKNFKKTPFFERKITLLTKDKKEIPFLATFFLTKNEIIIVGKEIQALVENQKKLEKEVKKRTIELERAKRTLEDAKTVLEIRVKAKTRQLQEQKEMLDELVKKRTKELQKKINELKKFQEISLGREYRIFQLKEELKGLKKEIESLKKKLKIEEK